MQTVQELYSHMRESLRRAGIERPEMEARILVRDVTGMSDAALIAGEGLSLSEEQRQSLLKALDRRSGGEPLSRIRGRREFWGLDFKVSPAVLDPRPDTEILVEAAIKAFGKNPPRTILDLGTGSGCILIALLHEWPAARGTGVDISPEALAVARGNAHINGVADRCSFVEGDWTGGVTGTYDLIVSNPPYIPSADIANLAIEVRNHDPILALDGGKDGLESYKKIFLALKKFFHKNTRCFFEVGISQMQQVERLARNAGLSVKNVRPDLAGILRVVEISAGEK